MNRLSPAEKASIKALQQLRSCIDNNQCFRLEAGAGAGKTYSLIESIRYLIDQRADKLVRNEQQIACITYTNVAKDEIKDRTDHHPVIFADTIHAFCWNILKHYQEKLREYIPDLGEKWQKRVDESVGITNQIVKYELGFPGINEYEITLHHDDVVALMARMLSYSKFQKLLKSRFPIILIDEYQDTDIHLAESIVSNLIDNNSGVVIGLFGDHWQKIYGSSACGLISSKAEKIVEIGKKANFRSDKNIVDCLNRMRPQLPQAEYDPQSTGVVKIYHSNSWLDDRRKGSHWKGDLPEENVKEYIEKVKGLMVGDGWDMSSGKTKILFLTNNLIASEQDFKDLAACFPYSDDYLKKGDKYIKFFLEVLEPTISAFENRQYGDLFQIGRKTHPNLKCQQDKKKWVESLKKLAHLRNSGSVGDIIDFLAKSKMPRLPDRIVLSEEKIQRLSAIGTEGLDGSDQKFIDKLSKFRNIKYQQVINLGYYIDDKTPFSTKHGVKGAQFNNVFVICGRGWNHYNWNQMLEWFDGSYPAVKEDFFERNRNLFYVCCSRAKHKLTILFTQELSINAVTELENIFGKETVIGDPLLMS